jgi:polar amino acid transport system substrate-binding protein
MTTHMRHVAAALVVLCVLRVVDPAAQSSVLAPTGTLRVTFLGGNPVHSRVDPSSNVRSGVVPDLAQELARRTGVPLRILPAENAGAVTAALASGQADVGVLAYDEARAREVDFTAPFMVMHNSYLVKSNAPLRQSADVDRAGLIVAAVKGQTQQLFVSRTLKNARVQILDAMPPESEVLRMLSMGEVHAFAINRQRALDLQAAVPSDLRALPDSFLDVDQCFVVKLGDTSRRDALNRFVSDVRSSGAVAAAIARAKLAGVAVATGSGR